LDGTPDVRLVSFVSETKTVDFTRIKVAQAPRDNPSTQRCHFLEAHLANFLFAPRRRRDSFMGTDQVANVKSTPLILGERAVPLP
jgi:hypothetical protein